MIRSLKRTPVYLGFLVVALLAAACGGVSNPDGWAPPVEEGDTIYVSRDSGELSAMNASGDTLTEIWTFGNDDEFACGNEIEEENRDLRGIYGAPVVRDGRIYFGAYDGNVYALDEENGACVWVFEGADGAIVGGVALTEDTLYFGSDDGNLYGVDPATGANKIGPFDAGDAIWTTPLIVENGMYFSTVGGKVWALTASDLHPMWDEPFQTSAGLITDPVIAAEVLVVGGFGQKLFGLNPQSGEEVWSQPFEGDNWFWGRPAVDGEKLYYPNLDHRVYAVNAATGDPVWENPFQAEDAIRAAPVLLDNGSVLAVVDRTGNTFSIDPASGVASTPNPIRLEGKVLADPIEFGDGILVLTDSGSLLEVDPTGGTPPRVVQAQ
jgi:outer membrane protein assembly factor BamB